MPIIYQNITLPNQRLAVWEIIENEDKLLSELNLPEKDLSTLASFSNKTRKQQWLAVRNLLREFNHNVTIDYSLSGKPYLADHHEYISVSHSGKYAAVSLNEKGATGIDIEEVNPRILKIAERFTNEMEKAYLKEDILVEQLCIIWGAKEVLFKMMQEGGISFKENFFIKPFLLGENGSLVAEVNMGNTKQSVVMDYKRIGNYFLVYSKNSEL